MTNGKTQQRYGVSSSSSSRLEAAANASQCGRRFADDNNSLSITACTARTAPQSQGANTLYHITVQQAYLRHVHQCRTSKPELHLSLSYINCRTSQHF